MMQIYIARVVNMSRLEFLDQVLTNEFNKT